MEIPSFRKDDRSRYFLFVSSAAVENESKARRSLIHKFVPIKFRKEIHIELEKIRRKKIHVFTDQKKTFHTMSFRECVH